MKIVRRESPDFALDAMDRKILRALHANGRLTNRDLAALVSLSPSGTLSRVRRLERTGAIRGYRAVLDPAFGQRRLAMWVNLALVSHTHSNMRRFEEILIGTPEVVQAWKVAGQSDYHIRLTVVAPCDWNGIVERWREAGFEFRNVETQVELIAIKDGAEWSLPDE